MGVTEIALRHPRELRLLEPSMEVSHGSVWLRDYLERSGLECYVLGLSGGLDSATVAMWAARAVGGKRLRLYALPYGSPAPASADEGDDQEERNSHGLLDISSYESLEHARMIADLIPEVHYEVIDIQPAVDQILHSCGFAPVIEGGEVPESLRMAAANAKARVRASILRTLTNAYRGLLLGTENRTEGLLGYFTAGGDDQSDIEILPAFFKAQVRQLAAQLGVPEVIIEKAPSADLWANQTDEAELGFSYEHADMVLYYAGDFADASVTERRMLAGVPSAIGGAPIPHDAIGAIGRVLRQRDQTQFKRLGKATLAPMNRTHL